MKEIEQEFLESGGVWKKEIISNLFSIKTSKSVDKGKLQLVNSETDYQFIGRTSVNNGIQGYVEKLDSEPNPKNTFSVVQIGENVMQFRDKEWYASQNLFLLTPKNDNLIKNKLFFITLVNASLKKFGSGYSSYPTLKTLAELEIFIPQINDENAYEFMENFIAELKALRVAELRAYLQAKGLSNYTLTDDELAVIEQFNNGKMVFNAFEYQDIFDRIQQGRRLKKDDQIAGDIPFVMSGVTNTGVVNYISNPIAVFPKNSITMDIFGNAFYRSYDYGMGDDTGAYWDSKNRYTREMLLYLTTAMNKSVEGKFSYGHKLRSSQSLSIEMLLPIKNNQPNFEFMETFISAIQKLVIKDAVAWADREIETTEQVAIA